jgi:DNA topoisomerase-1
MGNSFSAKDFRTWGATVAALQVLAELAPTDRKVRNRKAYNDAIKATAHRLGNTCAVCKKHYVHPMLYEAFCAGHLAHAREQAKRLKRPARLSLDERALLHLLQQQANSGRKSEIH